MYLNEKELVRRCQESNRNAQEEIYRIHSDRLYRLASRYVSDQAAAEDVLVTAFTKAFARIQSFEFQGDGSLAAWLRKVVVNESLMWLRRQHNFNLTETLDANLEEPDMSQLTLLEGAEIYQLINRLPTGYRTVFNLHVVEGHSHGEIAGMLQISEATSRSQLFKAKAQLKKILTREGYHYGT